MAARATLAALEPPTEEVEIALVRPAPGLHDVKARTEPTGSVQVFTR